MKEERIVAIAAQFAKDWGFTTDNEHHIWELLVKALAERDREVAEWAGEHADIGGDVCLHDLLDFLEARG